MGYRRFAKDPDEVLDYLYDFAALTNGNGDEDYLQAGETISTYSFVVPTGITKDSDVLVNGDTSVKVWLSGGTLGESYNITCRIDTDAGRTVDRTMTIVMVNK